MSMNILVAGATGGTGQILTRKILEAGHIPIAHVRESSDRSKLPAGTKERQADLTDLPGDICNRIDAVVFAAGSGGKTGPEMTDKIDRDGAKHLIDLSQQEGVTRFVMLSSFGADQANPEGDLAHYLKAKHDADAHLMACDLTHAILRPVALTDDGDHGTPILGASVDPNGTASRTDVAKLLCEAAIHGVLDGQAVDMQSA